MADATRELSIVISAKDEASKVLGNFKDKMSDISKDIQKGALALTGLGAATGLVAKQFVDAASFMEQQRVSFQTLTGDIATGQKTLNDLVEFAKKTPFEIPQILEQSKRLLAMGTTADELIPTFRALGDVAAGVGMEKLPQLVLAFGQIQARGRLMGTELRQLTEAGFNLADAMGVTNAELEEMIEQGTVKFEDVKEAFISVTSEGGRFHNMMQDQAGTTAGKLSNLNDNMFKLKATIGEALLPAVNTLIEKLIPLIEAFAAWATENQTLLAVMIAVGLALGAVGAAVLILWPIVTGIIAVFSALVAVFQAVIAIVGVVVAILGGPLTVIILAVIAIGAALYLAWHNNWFGIRDVVQKVVDWFKNTVLPFFSNDFGKGILAILDMVSGGWITRFNAMRSAVEGVINMIRSLISAAQDLATKASKGLKIPGFQHGGFVPGTGFTDAIPAFLHPGERVITKTGADVNTGGGNNGSVTLNFYGDMKIDDENRVQELADRIINILGRQNELAGKGLAI